MSESNIFSKAPILDYSEVPPQANWGEFKKVVEGRRSIRVFDGTPIPESVML